MTTQTEAQQAVARGATEIDRVWAGPEPWIWVVDLDSLSMYSTGNCVLGQLYGDLHAGYETLWPDLSNDTPEQDHSLAYGFNAPWNDPELTLADLTVLWREEILRLRQQRGKTT